MYSTSKLKNTRIQSLRCYIKSLYFDILLKKLLL